MSCKLSFTYFPFHLPIFSNCQSSARFPVTFNYPVSQKNARRKVTKMLSPSHGHSWELLKVKKKIK